MNSEATPEFDSVIHSFARDGAEAAGRAQTDAGFADGLMELEEGLAAALYASREREFDEPASSLSESELAELADALLTGDLERVRRSLQDDRDLLAVYRTASAVQAMAAPLANLPLPEALAAAIERVFPRQSPTADAAPAKLPAMILSLAEEGLRVLKSSLQSVQLEAVYSPAVRSAAAPAANARAGAEEQEAVQRVDQKASRLTLSQRIPASGGEAVLHFDVLRENAGALTLVVHTPEELGRARVNLKLAGRSLDSRYVSAEARSLEFTHLGPGEYELEFSGPRLDSHSCAIVIRR